MLKLFVFIFFQVLITSTFEQNDPTPSFENEVLNLLQEIKKIEKEIIYNEEKINELSWIRFKNPQKEKKESMKPATFKLVFNSIIFLYS